jgi:hypothetical protein
MWAGLTQGELVIRARAANGPWGPPWRLAVPGARGETPALGSALSASQQEPTVAVHRPGIGNSALTASWSAVALTSPPFGLLFCLAPALRGWSGGTLDGRSQWWWMEDGRSVDIYF